MHKHFRYILVVIALVTVASILIAPQISVGKITASPGLSNCSPISRGKYPFRHWLWSGIFPFEGGFIPDPHFSCSELVPVPSSVQTLIGDPLAKFQIIAVNPAFADSTSEVVLILNTRNRILEYKLPVPQNEGAVLGEPMYPEARLFPYKRSIAVLTYFMETKQIFLLSCPLNPEESLKHFGWQQKEATEVLGELKSLYSDADVRQHFCGPPNKPFIAFYERFSGPCSPAGNSSDVNFADFW
jgi:hypothetical protein